MADTRGSWTLEEAINKRWDANALEAEFRSYWTQPASAEYSALNDGEARPCPPGPYCVYEVDEGLLVQSHSGKTGVTENQIISYRTTFRIHAKTAAGVTGKSRARVLAEKVAAAFDPGAGAFDIAPDSHVNTIREPDFCFREDDDEWVWVVPYSFVIDAEYDRNPSIT